MGNCSPNWKPEYARNLQEMFPITLAEQQLNERKNETAFLLEQVKLNTEIVNLVVAGMGFVFPVRSRGKTIKSAMVFEIITKN